MPCEYRAAAIQSRLERFESMRSLVLFLAVAALAPTPVMAQATPPAATAPAPTAPAAAAAAYTSADTELGLILDDPAAKAALEKAVPGMTTNDQIEMARGMTLKAIQQYVPEQLTDAKLAEIDAAFAQLKKK
jgi:hypothetical protein